MRFDFDNGLGISRCFDEALAKMMQIDLDEHARYEFSRAWKELLEARMQKPQKDGFFLIKIEWYPEKQNENKLPSGV
jgi:hypothetical protein